MEEMYLKGQKVDWATDQTSLKTYFDKYYDAASDCFDEEFCELSSDRKVKSEDEDEELEAEKIMSLFGAPLSWEEFNILKNCCSPKQLETEGENPEVNVDKLFNNPGSYEKAVVPVDVNLETFKRLRNHRNAKDLLYVCQKYKNQIHLNYENRIRKKRVVSNIPPGEHFIVVVRIFFPFLSSIGDEMVYQQACCSQEVTLLGDNTLADLKDIIICMEEYGDAAGDTSENPTAPVKTLLKHEYTSSMFYIGNTFYIDQRSDDNIDYSEVVRSWAEKRNMKMNNVRRMEAMKIYDLEIKFGYPYLYQHLGDCEHLIVFSDARLLLPDDDRNSTQYPMHIMLGRKHSKNCYMCKNNTSKWFVVGSDRVTRDPWFVCNACFKLYFYKNNKKVDEFQAYHYADTRAVM